MIRDIAWELAARMPAALKGHAQGAIGNGIVLCCGTQFETQSPGDVRKGTVTALGRTGWILDTRASTYDRLPDAPVGGAAVADDFYVLTGMLPDSGASPRMFRLSLSSAAPEWREMPPLNAARFIPGISVAGTTIHVVGGEVAGDGVIGCGADDSGHHGDVRHGEPAARVGSRAFAPRARTRSDGHHGDWQHHLCLWRPSHDSGRDDRESGGRRLPVAPVRRRVRGGECLTPHAGASDELLVGRIVIDGQGSL